ncbi:hypothetical protein bcere0026_54110 [Bacillus mycoides]|uniref:Uncharacterized protein n=1 Tax=Bacillus mycoides TaxID=1405 RepID=C2Y363_BACMY|nr:hypothetical protein bcere0026_54110 [Bacillus mycoides]
MPTGREAAPTLPGGRRFHHQWSTDYEHGVSKQNRGLHAALQE